MCLGIPGRLVEIVDAGQHLATVDVSGVRRTISIRLVAADGPQVGDWVLVHVGFALAVIDEAEATRTLEAMEKLGAAYQDEIEAFGSSAIP
ncbi:MULTISPECIES: HypC/HybG/HupF family hydrogenase formation chaperone [Protofrankia]|uniref:Hydrogenase assembly chaperone hypC/hupF n=1 Tax=Candidatus Protofrankia datiscae TaxID=2716812 RepID=F8B250_9ACTN|nr:MULTISPECIES: HypC/HybG/HupF family hydrogenase formation chaperone [Protofrankia]AEH09844.1 hydrogenase assembly chaperone hypC/hupF [Candidatus Protofrankia datiscae]